MAHRRPIPPGALSVLALSAALTLAPAPLLAQAMSEGGEIAEVVLVRPHAGQGSQFEEGVKRHMALSAEMENPSPWLVWEVITGENTGAYVVGTFGHEWSDFDQRPSDPSRVEQSFQSNIEPHVAEATVAFWRYREDLSRGNGSTAPAPFTQVYYYLPRYEGAPVVEETFRRVRDAAEAAQWAGGDWGVYQLINGGELPQFVVAIPADNFADMAEPSPNLWEMLVSQMGETDATAMFERFVGAMRSENSEMLAFRQDLSYLPGGM